MTMVAINKEDFETNHAINLYDDSERYIFCHAGHETVLDKLKTQKVKLEHSFTVQQAETVINLVNENNGIGILSELVLNATPNSLKRHPVEPSVQMDIGLIANDLSDLTPVATALMRMIQDTCIQYKNKHAK